MLSIRAMVVPFARAISFRVNDDIQAPADVYGCEESARSVDLVDPGSLRALGELDALDSHI